MSFTLSTGGFSHRFAWVSVGTFACVSPKQILHLSSGQVLRIIRAKENKFNLSPRAKFNLSKCIKRPAPRDPKYGRIFVSRYINNFASLTLSESLKLLVIMPKQFRQVTVDRCI